jgi:hypothetical protein
MACARSTLDRVNASVSGGEQRLWSFDGSFGWHSTPRDRRPGKGGADMNPRPRLRMAALVAAPFCREMFALGSYASVGHASGETA